MKGIAFAIAATALFVVSSAQAGDVSVKGAHLCCGACVKGVSKALDGVKGVTGVKADRKAKSISFTAADDSAAEAGIKALAKGGFYGTAKHGDKKLSFPDSGAKKGDKGDSVTVTSVHLCCGACVSGVKKALKGIGTVSCDQKAKSVTVKGSGIETLKIIGALNKAGFYAKAK